MGWKFFGPTKIIKSHSTILTLHSKAYIYADPAVCFLIVLSMLGAPDPVRHHAFVWSVSFEGSWTCCSCLAIGAPDPDLKLQILSDIAQQHEVEWDSHRAHQEMLSGLLSTSHAFRIYHLKLEDCVACHLAASLCLSDCHAFRSR